MEVLSKEIFSEKDPNELRVAIVSEIRRVAPASFFYILISNLRRSGLQLGLVVLVCAVARRARANTS